MLNFKEQTAAYAKRMEAYLNDQCFRYTFAPQQDLFASMRYSLLAGGKRLRPILVYHFCRMAGGDWEKADCFAAAIEMIHTYSLIHDDLPAMDNDDYRRGRLTNHKVYGEAMAILAGDGLLTAAFSYIAKAPYSADVRIRAVEIVSQCAGELGMVGGQVLDIQSEERACTQQEVLDIQSRKTGALICAACMLGVLAAEGSEAQLTAAADFASNLGLAFQIRDDMLDVIGNQADLGKAVGVDGNKNTFVQLFGLDRCDEMVKTYTANAINSLKHFEDKQYMIELANYLTGRTN